MKNGKLTISAEVLNIPVRDAQALLDNGDGDAALLYLHILRSGGLFDAARAAAELKRSDRDIGRAADQLRLLGVLSGGGARPSAPAPAQELPEYRVQEVARRSMESGEFKALLEAVQQTLGRILSSADMKKLFGIYDELALPAEVILLLVQYCKELSAEKFGRERTVGFAFIEKEAYEWANRELVTYEQAERWLRERTRRRSVYGQLQRELGVRDRGFSKTELSYIDGWLDLGFSPEAVGIAGDRTLTNTGKLSWNYMDKIVRSWHAAGLHTPEEIEKNDPRAGKKAKRGTGGAEKAPRGDKKTMEQLDRLLASMETNEQ